MIERVMEATRMNAVLNHPDVFPWVASNDVANFDLSPVMDRLTVLMNEYGGFIFDPKGDGVYEVHTQFLPEGRFTALEAAESAARYMFAQDCELIRTMVPEGNKGAKRLVEAMRFIWTERDGWWTYPDGRTVPIDWYELSKERWQCQPQ